MFELKPPPPFPLFGLLFHSILCPHRRLTDLHFALDASCGRPPDLVHAAHRQAFDTRPCCYTLQLPHQDILAISTLLDAPRELLHVHSNGWFQHAHNRQQACIALDRSEASKTQLGLAHHKAPGWL